MLHTYNQIENMDNYFGSLSTSYDYSANFINVKLQAYHTLPVISQIQLHISLNLLNGLTRKITLFTNNDGVANFYYDLATVESITISGTLSTDFDIPMTVSHHVTIVHPEVTFNPLTIFAFVDGFYVDITGKLSDLDGDIEGKTIQVIAKNFDIDEHQINFTAKTDKNGWYMARILLNDGDWEFEAIGEDGQGQSFTSGILNIVERREKFSFIGNITTYEKDFMAMGFRSELGRKPDTYSEPFGNFELIESNLFDNTLWVDEIYSSINGFRTAFILSFRGINSSGYVRYMYPEMLALSKENNGFLRGSTVIINDTEKYNMGVPYLYSEGLYFSPNNSGVKALIDKYFSSGTCGKTFKIEWIFWV